MSTIKILIADDEERMRRLVSDFLKKCGYCIVEAEDGRKAIDIFYNEQKEFDLIILDVMMPYIDGWNVLREIRQKSQVPVIMLTAKSEESDELLGFSIGADEYITKPFSPMVLVARVQALLKRLGSLKVEKLQFDGLEIDETGHIILVNGTSIDLTPKEFELLAYFAKNEGIALSREQILNSVWTYDYLGDDRTVDTHIKKLRIKLGEKGDYIKTIRGIGYKFEVAE